MKIKNLEDVFRQLPLKGEVAFASKRGKFQEKVKKQQLRVLRDFVEDLKHVLEEGEEILFASNAVSPFTMLEQATTGAWILHIKKCILVLTDRRLLHFPADYKLKPRNSVAQIRFQDLQGFKGKRRITFRYKNGVRETFSQVRYGKRLVQLLRDFVTTSSTRTQHGGRQHLCPKCVAPLARERYTCPRCRFQFKEPGAARLYSIFLPGGGYFYTRHPWMGIGDAIVETVLIFFAFVFLLGHFLAPGGNLESLILGAIFVAVLMVEKAVTVYHAGHFIREYIPVEKRFARIPQPKQQPVRIRGKEDDLYDEKVRFE